MKAKTGKIISLKELKKIAQARIYENPEQLKKTIIRQYEEISIEEEESKKSGPLRSYTEGEKHD